MISSLSFFSALRKKPQFFYGVFAFVTIFTVFAFPSEAGDPRSPAQNSAPARIISLAPNLTEIVADLGLVSRLVAVTRFCDYPPEVTRLPRVGGFLDPDLERIIELKPDLVLMLQSASQRTEKRLKDAGLRIHSYRIETVSDLLSAYADLGRLLNVEAIARSRARAIKMAFNPPPIKPGSAPPPTRNQRIVFIVSRPAGSFKTLLTTGKGTYFEDLVRALPLAGFALQTTGYVSVSLEALLQAHPDIIAEILADNEPSDPKKRIREWDLLWKQHPHPPRIIVLKGNHFLRAGPRLVSALNDLRSALQPGPDNPAPDDKKEPR